MLLVVSSCAYQQTGQTQPRLHIISDNIQFTQDGPNVTVTGKVFFTNISRVPAWNVKLQVVFMNDGKIIGIVDKEFPGETIQFDQVKEFEFTKDLFVPTNEPIDLLINSWYQGNYATIYRR